MRILRGITLTFIHDPFDVTPENAVQIHQDGAVLIDNGKIMNVAPFDQIVQTTPKATVEDLSGHVLCSGFIDAHVHYPQTGIIASWGKRLIDWLNTYTFPEEMRFGDAHYAQTIADQYLDLALAHGTTTAASFCTIHPQSVDALFQAAKARNMCFVAGKTCMDRNAPEGLRDTVRSAYDESRALIEKWHGVDRLHYAITPRFSPTSTPEQLQALGDLWGRYPDCLMQTHLSEQTDEIAWVKSLFPQARDYLDTYERFGLLGEKALFGHAIHLEPREMDRLAETGAAVVHCPTSNTFIGSGVFDMAKMKTRGISVGLATDTGGGSSFSMLRTMAAAYEIGQLAGTALHPAQLLWLATCGSAKALHLDHHIGNLATGMDADIIAINLASTPVIAQRSDRANNIWEAVFPTIMMGDDRAIAGVWVAGNPVLC